MTILIVHKKNPSRRWHLIRAREYAAQHGERLVLVMKDPTWEAEYADQIILADTGDVGEVLTAAKELAAAGQQPLHGVLTFAEASVPAAARVAAEFGLPSVSERTATAARDKFAMRSEFAKADDVPQPRFGLARTLAEARAEAERIGFPLVLKPVLGTGSMYVRSVADEAELAEYFDFLRQGAWQGFTTDPLYHQAMAAYDGALLLEEFVGGTEISVECLVVDGETRVVALHDKPLPTGPTFEEVYACTPTRLPADLMPAIEKATAAVHRALGIDTGGTHVEFRLRQEREPVVLEAAARLGGGPICRSVHLSTGVDMVGALLDLATGRTPVIEPREHPDAVGFWNIFPKRGGRLTAVHGVEQALADERVKELEIYREIGETLAVPPQTFQGHGHLIFTADGVDRLDETFTQLTELVRLETEPA